jgi:hypothetical protein
MDQKKRVLARVLANEAAEVTGGALASPGAFPTYPDPENPFKMDTCTDGWWKKYPLPIFTL